MSVKLNDDKSEQLKKFTNIIRDRRKQMGLTQEEFAKLCGINDSYYGRIETGKSIPTLNKVLYICEALDIPIYIDGNKL